MERDRMSDQRVVGLELTQVPAVFGLLRVDLYNNATSSCCELVEEGKLAKNLWGDVLRHNSTLAAKVAPFTNVGAVIWWSKSHRQMFDSSCGCPPHVSLGKNI